MDSAEKEGLLSRSRVWLAELERQGSRPDSGDGWKLTELGEMESDTARKEAADLRTLIRLATATQEPEGWVLVPREPTPDMMAAGDEAMVDTIPNDNWLIHVRNSYRAMISAAPLPPPPAAPKAPTK